MSELKAVKNIEKVKPDGVKECGLPRAPYYVIHYEDGTSEEADFIAEHDEDVIVDDEDDDEPVISKEEFLRDLDSALHDLKLSMEGKLKFRPIEELFDELARDDDEELKAIAQ